VWLVLSGAAMIMAWKDWNSASASVFCFAQKRLGHSEADAVEMAQPEPVKPISLTRSFSS